MQKRLDQLEASKKKWKEEKKIISLSVVCSVKWKIKNKNY
jgi:hypothetical protein